MNYHIRKDLNKIREFDTEAEYILQTVHALT